jgi:cytochrome b
MWAFSGVIDFMIWLSIAMIWIAIAVWPAKIAARKGHSFIGYFLLSLLFFPLALIMAGFAKDRTGTFAPSHASADSTFVAPP